MALFVVLDSLAKREMAENRAVVFAVRKSSETLDDGFRSQPFCPRKRHAAVLGNHDRHHGSRRNGRRAAKGAPFALRNAFCRGINVYPQRHHVPARRAPHDADAVGNIGRLVREKIARVKKMVFYRFAVQPAPDVTEIIFVYTSLDEQW